MRSFRDISIRRKLTAMMMLTSLIVLLLAVVSFGTNDLVTFRWAMIKNLSMLAEVIGSNSIGALSFDDREFAKNVLAALDANPHVVFACIYNKEGDLFAKYITGKVNKDLSSPQREDYRLNRNWCGKLTLFLPFSRCFTGSYFKIKKVPFFILNTIVKILIS